MGHELVHPSLILTYNANAIANKGKIKWQSCTVEKVMYSFNNADTFCPFFSYKIYHWLEDVTGLLMHALFANNITSETPLHFLALFSDIWLFLATKNYLDKFGCIDKFSGYKNINDIIARWLNHDINSTPSIGNYVIGLPILVYMFTVEDRLITLRRSLKVLYVGLIIILSRLFTQMCVSQPMYVVKHNIYFKCIIWFKRI